MPEGSPVLIAPVVSNLTASQPPSAYLFLVDSSSGEGLLSNLFENLPLQTAEEVLTELLARPGVRIERIVSHGQFTPVDAPFDQDHDEWVLLLRGSASLWMDGVGEQNLRPGDHVLIPAHCIHRVAKTADSEPTVWLAIHFQ
jgi:cupin 2 domain-containing protein